MSVTRRIYTSDKTHPYVWHHSSIRLIWLIHMFDITHSQTHLSSTYSWHDVLILWYDSFICVTWPIHICDIAYSCVWMPQVRMCHVTLFLLVPWLTYGWVMVQVRIFLFLYSYMWQVRTFLRDPFICVT